MRHVAVMVGADINFLLPSARRFVASVSHDACRGSKKDGEIMDEGNPMNQRNRKCYT